MMSCLSLDLESRTEMYPERSSIAMRAWVLPPTEAVANCWRSNTSTDAGRWGREAGDVEILIVQARQEP